MYFVEKTKGINLIKRFEYPLFIAVLVLSLIGMLVLSSAVFTKQDGASIMKMQTIGLCIGIVLSLIISAIDYKDFKTLGFVFYIFSICLLILVLVIGTGDQLGSRSWFRLGGVSFQPSEIAKITFIIVISVFLERIKEGNADRKNIIKLGIYSIIPIALVVAQKDFGTTLVFIFIFFVMIFICGVPYKYILTLLGIFFASLPFVWMFVLNDKRKERILTFISPERDPQGAGFNVLRSKMAIGSGQIYGEGLFKGIQTQSGGVPVKESDFIFSVVGEELGFIGATVIIVLVFFILLRSIYIARNSRDLYGSFLVVGVISMMSFNFFENIGMSIGLLPVTGLPLPFISAGGTAMITNYIAIGIILSVSMRRKKVIFDNSQ
ncbi:MAG: rod shape-determining protein RodA [Clostridia bacterium]|nr:rod shape-determining protein RodA [Clostridia bacterium]